MLSSPVVERSPFNPRDLPASFAPPLVSEELMGFSGELNRVKFDEADDTT
jgi:hypothetical protein